MKSPSRKGSFTSSSEEVLENILESESDGHAADAEHLDEVGGVEGWRHHGKRYEKTQNDDAGLDEPANEQRHSLVGAALQGEATGQGFAGCGQNQETTKIMGAIIRFGKSEILVLMIETPVFQ